MVDRGCQIGSSRARLAVGYVAMSRGATIVARRELEAALAFGEGSERIDAILPPLWGLAETALLDGDPERAAAICRDALDRARLVDERIGLVPFVVTGVRAEQAAGRPDAAETWLADCAAMLSGPAWSGSPALDHGRGLVALRNGATGIARQALEAAVRGWDAVGRVWEGTWARLDLAECLSRSSQFGAAANLAVDARSIASRLDSAPLAARADALQRLARGRVAVDEPWRPLTAREFAVARLVTEGLTNGEIADSLGIAPKTASSHVEHILAKLGASRRAEIAAWASHVDRTPTPH
jgi:DNA-binding CsgD family transcriptional regulator